MNIQQKIAVLAHLFTPIILIIGGVITHALKKKT